MANKNTNTALIGVGLLVIIIIMLYLMCFLCPYNLCPDWCGTASGSEGDDDDQTEDSCPDLAYKLVHDSTTTDVEGRLYTLDELFSTAEDLLLDFPADVVRTATLIGIEDELSRIPCNLVVHHPIWAFSVNRCNSYNGMPFCNPTMVGCSCTTKSYSGECGYVIDPNHPFVSKCSGYCDEGSTCGDIGGQCACSQDETELTLCGEMGANECALGACDDSHFCDTNVAMTGCECYPYTNL